MCFEKRNSRNYSKNRSFFHDMCSNQIYFLNSRRFVHCQTLILITHSIQHDFFLFVFNFQSKLRQINENTNETKIEFICIVRVHRDLFNDKNINDMICENNDDIFNCFYHMSNFFDNSN